MEASLLPGSNLKFFILRCCKLQSGLPASELKVRCLPFLFQEPDTGFAFHQRGLAKQRHAHVGSRRLRCQKRPTTPFSELSLCCVEKKRNSCIDGMHIKLGQDNRQKDKVQAVS